MTHCCLTLEYGRVGVAFAGGPESIICTRPATGLSAIWEQRKRWASKCIYYGRGRRAVMIMIFAFYLWILLCAVLSLWKPALGITAAAKALFDYMVVHRSMRIFKVSLMLRYFIPVEMLHIPMTVLGVLWGTFGTFSWKDGRVRKNA